MLRFALLWLIVVLLFSMDLFYLILLLRRKPSQRTTQNWIGLLGMSIISLAALLGMLFLQLREIDPLTSDSWLLFLAAMYAEPLIASWSQIEEARLFGPLSPRWYQAYAGFVLLFALFALAAVIFHL